MDLFLADISHVHYEDNFIIMTAVALIPITSNKDASENSSVEYYVGDKVRNLDIFSFELSTPELSKHLETDQDFEADGNWCPIFYPDKTYMGVYASKDIEKTTILRLREFYNDQWPYN